jgi:hypothetical protein
MEDTENDFNFRIAERDVITSSFVAPAGAWKEYE